MLTTRVPCPRCGGTGRFCGACDRGDASLVNGMLWILGPWLAFALLGWLSGSPWPFVLAGVLWALQNALGRAMLLFTLAVFAFVATVLLH